jgi:hypothetical protein
MPTGNIRLREKYALKRYEEPHTTGSRRARARRIPSCLSKDFTADISPPRGRPRPKVVKLPNCRAFFSSSAKSVKPKDALVNTANIMCGYHFAKLICNK